MKLLLLLPLTTYSLSKFWDPNAWDQSSKCYESFWGEEGTANDWHSCCLDNPNDASCTPDLYDPNEPCFGDSSRYLENVSDKQDPWYSCCNNYCYEVDLCLDHMYCLDKEGDWLSAHLIVVILLILVIIMIIMLVLFCSWLCKRHRNSNKVQPDEEPQIRSLSPSQISADELNRYPIYPIRSVPSKSKSIEQSNHSRIKKAPSNSHTMGWSPRHQASDDSAAYHTIVSVLSTLSDDHGAPHMPTLWSTGKISHNSSSSSGIEYRRRRKKKSQSSKGRSIDTVTVQNINVSQAGISDVFPNQNKNVSANMEQYGLYNQSHSVQLSQGSRNNTRATRKHVNRHRSVHPLQGHTDYAPSGPSRNNRRAKGKRNIDEATDPSMDRLRSVHQLQGHIEYVPHTGSCNSRQLRRNRNENDELGSVQESKGQYKSNQYAPRVETRNGTTAKSRQRTTVDGHIWGVPNSGFCNQHAAMGSFCGHTHDMQYGQQHDGNHRLSHSGQYEHPHSGLYRQSHGNQCCQQSGALYGHPHGNPNQYGLQYCDQYGQPNANQYWQQHGGHCGQLHTNQYAHPHGQQSGGKYIERCKTKGNKGKHNQHDIYAVQSDPYRGSHGDHYGHAYNKQDLHVTIERNGGHIDKDENLFNSCECIVSDSSSDTY